MAILFPSQYSLKIPVNLKRISSISITDILRSNLRSEMGEAAFLAYWQKINPGQSPPSLPEPDNDVDARLQQLLQQVYTLLSQGTVDQQQQFAAQLSSWRNQLPSEAAPLAIFIDYLTVALQGEAVSGLPPLAEPFAAWWQTLQEAIEQSRGQSDEEE